MKTQETLNQSSVLDNFPNQKEELDDCEIPFGLRFAQKGIEIKDSPVPNILNSSTPNGLTGRIWDYINDD